jgi:hypothetical protein
MTTNPKPGSQPDPGDMSDAFGVNGEDSEAAKTHPHPSEEAEEEISRLGNFA